VTQTKVWGVKEDLPFNGGTLTTAGGLTFYGNMHGDFRARTPRRARSCGAPISARASARARSPILGGRQAVCRHRGWPHRLHPVFLGDVGKQMVAATPEGGALFVFSE
jgi:alcohol dehydrogenase (cytochrome c)